MDDKSIYGVLYRMIVYNIFSENERMELNILQKITLLHGLWF